MYKHVQKFTKSLREFSYDGLDLDGAVKQRFRKEDRAFLKEIDKKDDDKQFLCSLCKKWVSNLPNNARNHANSRGHRKRMKKWKMVYRKYMKSAKERVFNRTRPRNQFMKRLIYYKLIHNFQADI